MANRSVPRPETPEQGSDSTWQLKLLIGLIAAGVLSLILKAAGVF
jgi:hypothetical protein